MEMILLLKMRMERREMPVIILTSPRFFSKLAPNRRRPRSAALIVKLSHGIVADVVEEMKVDGER